MKRILALLLAMVMLFALAACGGKIAPEDASSPSAEPSAQPSPSESAEPVELIVFAAASMTETLTEIGEMYKTVAPNMTLTFTFDSSGTLKTQIAEGADCDVFISAAQKQMNELDKASDKNTEGLDFVLPDTRFNLLENQVALVVPKGNPADIKSFDEVANAEKIALGNSDVPVGQYSQEIFTNMGVWDALQSKITFGSNVKEVTTWVGEGTVDCGVVYSTDAAAAGLEIVAYAPAGMLKTPVVYPAAVMNVSNNVDAAKAFLDYLKSDACAKVFENAGFSIPAR
jgi:molybdate transport system substrate-binding protein